MKVGIDLGTTNSALAYIDPREAGESDFPPVHTLEIPQQVAPDRVEPRKTLPSFLLVENGYAVGAYARDQGALVPTRLVHSVKSWLSNPEVDRTAKILPWDSQETGRILSPVEVSARLLEHLRNAWEQAKGAPLAEQDVVLTVPASFDEEARELTVMAAEQAGLPKLTLLEEPAAAFYAWIAHHLAQSKKLLFDGMAILVCDVGGGTSDFTLIRVARQGDEIDFTRTAVGRHLLLGGDNLDLTLGWLVETKLGVPLSIRQRNAIRRQCTAAKERLLTDPNLKSVEVTVAGAGTALVGGALKTEILREEALELALDGFLPFTALSDKPKEEKRSLFREMGLPYVSDPAISRHLAAFLTGSRQTSGPDAILFNGGFFVPGVLRQRLADVVEGWYARRPAILENRDLDLAVAVGAAYYSHVRSTGAGLVVRGGLPRTYYIGIGGAEETIRTMCLVPRGAEEGTELELDRGDLQLVANRPVSFRLYSSLTRTGDALGDAVGFGRGDAEEALHAHAPLHAVIRFGKRTEERLIPVKLRARLTEIGTLEIWAESKISEHRWRLQFELRKQAPEAEKGPRRPEAVISDEALKQLLELIPACFTSRGAPPVSMAELPGRLEQILGLGRNSWPLGTLRRLGDALLEVAEGRRLAPPYEQRWLNLCGFCLRPGFGYPGDDFRIEQARRVWAAGLAFPNQPENEVQWWIFWGRLAGGLNRNQQVDVFQRITRFLLPRSEKERKQRLNPSLLREMWRAAASLELLPVGTKTELGAALARKVQACAYSESDLWCLARIGARELFYGPANQVPPPATVARWVEALLPLENAGEAIALLARITGDPVRDLPPALLERVRANLSERRDAGRLLALFEGEEPRDEAALARIFGEELPSGLVFGQGAGTPANS